MPEAPTTLKIKPGVDTQSTAFQTGAGLQTSNAIRHKNGFIQKMGGCTAMTASTFDGVADGIIPWQDLAEIQYLAIGTSTKLQLLSAGTITDISPAGLSSPEHWFLGKWGQTLVCNYEDSTIFQWTPPVAGGNVALAVSGAPANVYGLFVAAPEQQIIAFGIYSASLSEQDPLLVGWCDIANLNVWTAAVNNQAGTFRLTTGSKIEGGTWFGLIGLLWTDLGLWTMTYTGYPLVYGFNELSTNCGLIAHNAFARLGTVIVWMSQNDFFIYAGGQVQTLPCTVRDWVFNNLDRSNDDTIHADANTYWGTVTWRFPTAGSNGVCDHWVSLNLAEGLWDIGVGNPIVSAWTDQSVLGAPIGTLYTGKIEQFETSNSFDGLPVNSGFTSGWIDIQKGHEFFFVERVMPDQMLSSGGFFTLQFDFCDVLPADQSVYPIRSYGPYTVNEQTPFIVIDGRGRFMRVTLSCTDGPTFWRFGEPILIGAPDGSL